MSTNFPDRPLLALLTTVLLCPPLGTASVITYDGDVFPEEAGFDRVSSFDVDRSLTDGWFNHHVELGVWGPPPYGEKDYYNFDLPSFAGSPFFIEWRMISDAPDSEVNQQNGGSLVVLVGGPVRYHFNIASGVARIVRGIQYPVRYFAIEPGVAHTYRLEVFGDEYFEFSIDSLVVDCGLPESVFPTPDALMSFGTRYYRAESTGAWDYVKFGAIPEPATGLLAVSGAAFLLGARRRRRR